MGTPTNSKKILREIAKKYESDPKGWRLLWSIDKKGYHDFLVAKDSNLWWLKEQQLNPYVSVGCGVRCPFEEELINRVFDEKQFNPSFGYRPIQENQLRKIIETLAKNKSPQAPILEILRSEPRSLRELETSFLLQGPLFHVPRLTDILSDKQRELDAKLISELKSLILRRYPQLTMSYT